MAELAKEFHGALAMATARADQLPFWLALAGVVAAYVFYMVSPASRRRSRQRFGFVYRLLDNKYYMDWFNEHVLARARAAPAAASGRAATSASSTAS